MTTMNVEDISRKGRVQIKYNPNSYRIFCEDIGNNSVPYKEYNAPDIYTQPPILPAQAIEDRNRPHGGRAAGFLRENVRTLNEPVATMHIGSAAAHARRREQSRWWEWNTPTEDDDPLWKSKKRSQSTTNLNGRSANNTNQQSSGFQTTYQKEHGYLKDILSSKQPTRHAYNPENTHAIGIVPVNDFKTGPNNEQENIYIDRMSFDHHYNSRDANNYPHKGKRQGAFVLEHYAPKHELGTQIRNDSNKNASVWDCMHPGEQPQLPKQQISRQNTQSGLKQQQQQRRDPIGYFDDTKYINSQEVSNTRQQLANNNIYMPSWANGYSSNDNNQIYQQNGKELLENALNANNLYNREPAYVQN